MFNEANTVEQMVLSSFKNNERNIVINRLSFLKHQSCFNKQGVTDA